MAVRNYEKMREGVGMLLAELMRIKAEGDYDAIKALVDRYGVHFRSQAARPGGKPLREVEHSDLLDRHQSAIDGGVGD
jgi:hypothetical protein